MTKCACTTDKVSALNHKDLLDADILKYFRHDAKVFNKWVKDRNRDFIRDKGANKHEKHIGNLLYNFLKSTN